VTASWTTARKDRPVIPDWPTWAYLPDAMGAIAVICAAVAGVRWLCRSAAAAIRRWRQVPALDPDGRPLTLREWELIDAINAGYGRDAGEPARRRDER
jgi:hypothetical protein